MYLLTPIPDLSFPSFPFGNHKFVFCLWVSFCSVNKFVFIIFQIPHTSDIIWYFFCLSDLLRSVWSSLAPSRKQFLRHKTIQYGVWWDHVSWLSTVTPRVWLWLEYRVCNTYFSKCFYCVCLVTQSCLTLCNTMYCRLLYPWTFSRQEYWSGLPCLPPGDLLNPGLRLTIGATRKPENTGVGSLSLLQEIFPTQESNQGLLHCRQILY